MRRERKLQEKYGCVKSWGQDGRLRILPQPFFSCGFHSCHAWWIKQNYRQSTYWHNLCVKIELLSCSFLFKICIELCMPFTSNAEAASKRNAGESWKRTFISMVRPYRPLILHKNRAFWECSLNWRNLEMPASCFNSKVYLLNLCGSNAAILVKQIFNCCSTLQCASRSGWSTRCIYHGMSLKTQESDRTSC